MTQVIAIKPAGQWDALACCDEITLDSDGRHRRRAMMTTQRGMSFLLDQPHAMVLHDGDGLLLDDGRIVRVVAAPEELVEVAAADAHELARLAWHLGNRHVDVQIVGERLRLRRDHVLEAMLEKLGATLTPVAAPFEPERGAYENHGHAAHRHENEHGA